MTLRKLTLFFLVLTLSFTCISCAKTKEQINAIKPQSSQIKYICELATMECYYHNVAKYTEKDAQGILFWKKYKHFWIEYSGVVKIGIDVSLVTVEVEEDSVTISMPDAKVLDTKVDKNSLTKASYIVDGKSAKISAEDEIKAFEYAQEKMMKAASEDKALLASAQQRAQILLEEYVANIGNIVGKEYTIKWNYIKAEEQVSANISEEASDSEEEKGA